MLFFPHSPLYGFLYCHKPFNRGSATRSGVALTRVSACALFLQRLHQQVERRF